MTSNVRSNVRNVRGRRAQYGIKLTFYPDQRDNQITLQVNRSRHPLVKDLTKALLLLNTKLVGDQEGVLRCVLYRLNSGVSLISCQEGYKTSSNSNLVANSFHQKLRDNLDSMWQNEN